MKTNEKCEQNKQIYITSRCAGIHMAVLLKKPALLKSCVRKTKVSGKCWFNFKFIQFQELM